MARPIQVIVAVATAAMVPEAAIAEGSSGEAPVRSLAVPAKTRAVVPAPNPVEPSCFPKAGDSRGSKRAGPVPIAVIIPAAAIAMFREVPIIKVAAEEVAPTFGAMSALPIIGSERESPEVAIIVVANAGCEGAIAFPTDEASAIQRVSPVHFVPAGPAPIVVAASVRHQAGAISAAVETLAIMMREGAKTKVVIVPVKSARPVPLVPTPIMVGPNAVHST